jgi:hypothetical protein
VQQSKEAGFAKQGGKVNGVAKQWHTEFRRLCWLSLPPRSKGIKKLAGYEKKEGGSLVMQAGQLDLCAWIQEGTKYSIRGSAATKLSTKSHLIQQVAAIVRQFGCSRGHACVLPPTALNLLQPNLQYKARSWQVQPLTCFEAAGCSK